MLLWCRVLLMVIALFAIVSTAAAYISYADVKCTSVCNSGEAGRYLDLTFASGGKSDARKTVDLAYFLDAAHGGEFSHQTLLDRQRSNRDKVPHPGGSVQRPEPLSMKSTDVHVIWLQQELYLAKNWCVLRKHRPIWLLQRCLFCFGAQHHRYDFSLGGFFSSVPSCGHCSPSS